MSGICLFDERDFFFPFQHQIYVIIALGLLFGVKKFSFCWTADMHMPWWSSFWWPFINLLISLYYHHHWFQVFFFFWETLVSSSLSKLFSHLRIMLVKHHDNWWHIMLVLWNNLSSIDLGEAIGLHRSSNLKIPDIAHSFPVYKLGTNDGFLLWSGLRIV